MILSRIFGHFDLRHVLEPNSAHRGLCADWLHRCLDGCLRPEGDTVARYRGGQPLWIAVDFGCGQAEMEKKMQGLAPEDIFCITIFT